MATERLRWSTVTFAATDVATAWYDDTQYHVVRVVGGPPTSAKLANRLCVAPHGHAEYECWFWARSRDIACCPPLLCLLRVNWWRGPFYPRGSPLFPTSEVQYSDLHAPTSEDPKDLTACRARAEDAMERWLAEAENARSANSLVSLLASV
eukprot:1184426-Prorocentrum_minimum.AAC.2